MATPTGWTDGTCCTCTQCVETVDLAGNSVAVGLVSKPYTHNVDVYSADVDSTEVKSELRSCVKVEAAVLDSRPK